MKIGFFADGYLPQKNGVATSVAEYAEALQKKGHTLTIIAPKYPGISDSEKNVIRLSSISYKKNTGIRLAVYLPEKSFRELLKLDFDIIHGHGDGPITMLGWIIAKRKNIPFILSHHTFWSKYTHYLPAGVLIRPRIVEKVTQLFANSCSEIISPSKMSKKELENYGVTKPITVIPHGLDLSNYSFSNKDYLHSLLHIPKTNKIILYVGRLGKEKSVDVLLHAFALVQKNNPDTSFVLVGNGTQKESLEDLAKELHIDHNTHFLGEVDYSTIPSVFYSADIFAFASKTETLGKVLLEAMAAGLPVVTLNIQPFKELIKNKAEGILVSGTPTSIAKGIVALVENETYRKELSKNALIKSEIFSIDTAVTKIESIYEKQLAAYAVRKKKRITRIITRVKSFLDVEFK
jgi:1,2-diacylglycerol 3-alpha-glucosyltransferase